MSNNMTCSACNWNRQGGLAIAAGIRRRQEFLGTTLNLQAWVRCR